MALHEPPIPEWVIDVHERTLAAIRSADHQRIERVMDEHLAAMEQNWERETDRVLVPSIPDFLRPVAERSSGDQRPREPTGWIGTRMAVTDSLPRRRSPLREDLAPGNASM